MRTRTRRNLVAILGSLGAAPLAAQDCNGNGVLDALENPAQIGSQLAFGERNVQIFGDLILVPKISELAVFRLSTLLPVANVLAQDGCHDAVGRGNRIFTTDGYIDITNPGSPVYVPAGQMYGHRLALWGDYLYVLDGDSDELKSFDVSDPDNWVALDSLAFLTSGLGMIAADAGLLCVTDVSGDVHVLDADVPGSLSVSATLAGTVQTLGVELVDRTAYVAQTVGFLGIYDFTDPTQPQTLSLEVGGGSSVAVRGDRAFLGRPFEAHVVDVSDPQTPRVTNRVMIGQFAFVVDVDALGNRVAFKTDEIQLPEHYVDLWKFGGAHPAMPAGAAIPGFTAPTSRLSAAGDFLYVSSGFDGLDVVDVSRPDEPVHVGDWVPGADLRGFVAVDEYGYAADDAGALVVVDLSSPQCPTEAATVPIPSGAAEVRFRAPYAFVTTSSGLAIVDATDPTAPSLVTVVPELGDLRDVVLFGRYAVTFEDTARQVVDVADLDQGSATVVHQDAGPAGAFAAGAVFGRGFLQLSTDTPSLRPYSIDSSGQPVSIGTSLGLPADPERVRVGGAYAYVGLGAAGYAIVDLSHIGFPGLYATVSAGPLPHDFTLHRGRAYVASRDAELAVRAWLYEVAADCNDNGQPDECDIAGGTADVDGDGVPDSCEEGEISTCGHTPADDGGAPVLDCNTTERVSLTDGGSQICVSDAQNAKGGYLNKNSSHPWISGGGNVVVFTNEGNVSGEANPDEKKQVYARDVTTGDSVLVSGTQNSGSSWGGTTGIPAKPADNAVVSGDGRFVAFMATAQLPGDDDSPDLKYADIFLHDLVAGTTERISENRSSGAGGDAGSGWRPAISHDGQFVAFTSKATNLDGSGSAQSDRENVYLFDRAADTITLISQAPDSSPADGDSLRPSLSGDGCWIAFESDATNLDPAGSPGGSRIYVHRRATGRTRLVDRGLTPCADSDQGDPDHWYALSRRPEVSADGRWVVFESLASNLAPATSATFPPHVTLSDTDEGMDVFVADTATWTVRALDHGLTLDAEHHHELGRLSGDGRFVVFNRRSLEDAIANEFELWVHDRDATDSGMYDQPGNTLTFRITDASGCGQANSWSGGPGNLSEDGQYAVFVSDGSDLVSGDTNGDSNGPCSSVRGTDVFRRTLY